MSEVLRISSTDVKSWLERKTNPTLIPIHEKARRLLNEMESELEGITETSKMLLESSNREIEKKSKKTFGRARALQKLAKIFIKRMGQIEVPEEVSYVSLHDFTEQTQKAFLATEVDIKNWFSRISPYFILDRRKFQAVFEKAKNSLKDLQMFIKDEYVKTEILEKTFQLIDDLTEYKDQLENLKAQKEKIQSEKGSFAERTKQTEEKIEKLKNRETLSQIEQINKEIKGLRKDVKRRFRHLRKPFMKFQRLLIRHGGLTPAESKKLGHYIKKPLRAFATEEEGYPNLKKILREVNDSIDNGKLNLKRSRRRKAKEDIAKILDTDSLVDLHQKCREITVKKKQLAASSETEETRRNLRRLRNKLKQTKRMKKRVELEEERVDRNLKETQKTIEDYKDEVEKNVFNFLGKRISIDLQV